MKTTPSAPPRRQGNTLVITLVVTGVAGFLLTTYLTLLRAQNIATMRSQSWNAAMAVVEAGIEDALTHLNSHWEIGLERDGWQRAGDLYYMKRWVGEHYYVATITNYVLGATNNQPVIESRGFVSVPTLLASGSAPLLGSISPVVINGSKTYLGRGVRSPTRPTYLFAKGMVAKDSIDLYGNNIETDSFDSTLPAFSTNGRYDPGKRKDNGDIATNSSLTNSLNVGNANIRGKVATGPNGSAKIGANGTVGSLEWVASGKKGFEPGTVRDDMNVDFRDVKAPFSGGAWPLFGGWYNGTYYNYIMYGGRYQISNFRLTGQEKALVLGNSTLYVTSEFSMSGNSFIDIVPSVRLRLYVAAPSATLGGNGVLNRSANALNFAYYGLPQNRTLTYSGNAEFTGTIYAPGADFHCNGGGVGPYDFVGASITKTVRMNGHFKFHYDEALSKIGPIQGFVVNHWSELSPNQIAALPIDTSPRNVID